MIVVDTNVIAYLYLSAPRSEEAERVRAKDPEWAAPILWRSEFRNVLTLYVRREVLSRERAVRIAEESEQMMLGREYLVSSERVLGLAANSRCSAYECEFVALAQDLGVKLVTADERILSRFRETAVPLGGFPSSSA